MKLTFIQKTEDRHISEPTAVSPLDFIVWEIRKSGDHYTITQNIFERIPGTRELMRAGKCTFTKDFLGEAMMQCYKNYVALTKLLSQI